MAGYAEEDGSIREQLEALRIERDDEPRQARRWPWVVAIVVVVVVLAAGAWATLRRSAAPTVRVATAVARGAGAAPASVLDASGYVTARRRATIASKITGRLVEVAVEEGMPVEEGQVLARLDSTRQRAALALAGSSLESARRAAAETRARLDLARLTRDRAERLLAEGVVGQAEFDEAETQVAALAARLDLEVQSVAVSERELGLAEVDLEDTVIRAPFAGMVVSKDAQEGEMVSPVSAGGGFTRTGICTVVDMASLEIEVDVNEAYISRVSPGQRVEAVIDAYPDWRIPGHVITTIPTADRQKATVKVRIGFDEIDERVLPEMGVKVSFRDATPREAAHDGARPAVTVPAAALRRDGGRDVVFVVERDVVERRAVTAAAGGAGTVEIAAGLAAGERVVVEGPADLRDGDTVRIDDGD